MIPGIEQLVGTTIERLHADAGYRGHNAPADYKFKIYTSRQKRRLTRAIKREMRRRSAVEPVIGHLKDKHRLGRNYLAHRNGDLNNAILAAAGYNFRRLIRWLGIVDLFPLRTRETIQGVLGAEPRVHKDGDGRATRQSCPGCMAMKGGHQMSYKNLRNSASRLSASD